MLNDPVAVKISDERWWISIADSDLLHWVKAIAHSFRLDVLVDEPDISPLAIQGPKADDLMANVFGDSIRDIKFFFVMGCLIFRAAPWLLRGRDIQNKADLKFMLKVRILGWIFGTR